MKQIAVERVCHAHDMVEYGEPWYEVKVDGAVVLRLWGAELLALLHAISDLSHLSAYRFTQIGDAPPEGDLK